MDIATGILNQRRNGMEAMRLLLCAPAQLTSIQKTVRVCRRLRLILTPPDPTPSDPDPVGPPPDNPNPSVPGTTEPSDPGIDNPTPSDPGTADHEPDTPADSGQVMYRLYNPNSGEHFYTADFEEHDALVALGWNDEGYGWVAPKAEVETNAVYRLYNPNAGDHHYTMDVKEKNTLVSYGWKDEGIGWYSAEVANATQVNNTSLPVYRQYNPYANGAGSHNYTTDKAENDFLVSVGWTPEGTAWYGLK